MFVLSRAIGRARRAKPLGVGTPTSGGPPYRLYQIVPSNAFALPATAEFMPTRWRF